MSSEEPREDAEDIGFLVSEVDEFFKWPDAPKQYLTRVLVSGHRRRLREQSESSGSSGLGNPESEKEGPAG